MLVLTVLLFMADELAQIGLRWSPIYFSRWLLIMDTPLYYLSTGHDWDMQLSLASILLSLSLYFDGGRVDWYFKP